MKKYAMLLFILVLALPALAKDKVYEDGTLVDVGSKQEIGTTYDYSRGLTHARANGTSSHDIHTVTVQVQDIQYKAECPYNVFQLHNPFADFIVGKPVSVTFDKKRNWFALRKENGKATESCKIVRRESVTK